MYYGHSIAFLFNFYSLLKLCSDGELTLSATGALVGVLVIAEDVAFTFQVASAYDNFLVLAKS